MAKYGVPYRGSKARLADNIISILPEAENFYDLFAGGCAVTHCALVSGKYKNVFANDLQDAPQLFLDAINGKYRDEKRWISREQFHAEKAADPYIRWIWSFGNNGADYLFGRNIEPLKKAAHEYLFKNGYDGTMKSRLALLAKFKKDKKIIGRFDLERLERLERLEQLEQLERLERLQQLQQFKTLSVTKKDYRKVKIKPDSVVYCDIPYSHIGATTEKYYGVDFDTTAFYEWAASAPFPVYFSSITAPRGFKCVFKKEHQMRMDNSAEKKKNVIEKVFWNGRGVVV